MKQIAVIGIGGVGGFIGAKLARLGERDSNYKVSFIARGAQLEAIRNDGIRLDAEEGKISARPSLATERMADLPLLDYCFISVKGYALNDILHQLKGKINESTVIIPLLNGADIYERVRSVISVGYVHPAGIYISSFVQAPGHVVQIGPVSSIFLGKEPDQDRDDRSVLPILDAAGIKYMWKDDPFVEIWNKYIFIAPFGLVTAQDGKTLGEVFQSPEDLAETKAVMAEVVAVARAKGITLPDTIIDDTLTKAAKFPPTTRTSFQRDMELKEKPDERDLFGGTILRMGKQFGIPTPHAERLYAAILQKKPL
ncbi:MAG: 2-dehydropantoate 2-reductase [Spirochaetia bacterium]|jgi:2-dehydropantoate 2-reductase|nr:2-dehydropantoate 2-reductase [Spirochaetia bacterium]